MAHEFGRAPWLTEPVGAWRSQATFGTWVDTGEDPVIVYGAGGLTDASGVRTQPHPFEARQPGKFESGEAGYLPDHAAHNPTSQRGSGGRTLRHRRDYLGAPLDALTIGIMLSALLTGFWGCVAVLHGLKGESIGSYWIDTIVAVEFSIVTVLSLTRLSAQHGRESHQTAIPVTREADSNPDLAPTSGISRIMDWEVELPELSAPVPTGRTSPANPVDPYTS